MKFKNKQEQYEWWTETIRTIQRHDVSIRQGCRDHGVSFGQYYEWKERVQHFVDEGKVTLSLDESVRVPRGAKPRSSQSHSLSFVEITNSVSTEPQSLALHFKDTWRLEIPGDFNASSLSSVLKILEAL